MRSIFLGRLHRMKKSLKLSALNFHIGKWLCPGERNIVLFVFMTSKLLMKNYIQKGMYLLKEMIQFFISPRNVKTFIHNFIREWQQQHSVIIKFSILPRWKLNESLSLKVKKKSIGTKINIGMNCQQQNSLFRMLCLFG